MAKSNLPMHMHNWYLRCVENELRKLQFDITTLNASDYECMVDYYNSEITYVDCAYRIIALHREQP